MGAVLGIDLGIELGKDLGTSGDLDVVLGPDDIIAAPSRIAWFRSDSGVTEAGGRVSAWANIWANGDLAQATGANQPLYEANQFGAYPAIHLDDAARFMAGTLVSPVAIGQRVYQWVLMRLSATPGTTLAIVFVSGASSRLCRVGTSNSGGGTFGSALNSTGITNGTTGPATDTASHLLETGFVAANRFVVSAVGFGGAGPGALTTADLTTLGLGITGSLSAQVRVAEWIVALGDPSTTVEAQMRAYFRNRYRTI